MPGRALFFEYMRTRHLGQLEIMPVAPLGIVLSPDIRSPVSERLGLARKSTRVPPPSIAQLLGALSVT